jgi:hypothetical protein
MKMSQADYDALKISISRKVEVLGVDKIKAHRETLKSDPRVKNLDMRYRWDILNLKSRRDENTELFDRLYVYLNDDHIDTALKKIIKELSL